MRPVGVWCIACMMSVFTCVENLADWGACRLGYIMYMQLV